MKAKQLLLRCYIEKQGDLWVAVCIDLSLAAQANSPDDAREKLHLQVGQYLEEAFGEDSDHFEDLICRPAPLSQRLKYEAIKLRSRLNAAARSRFKAARQNMGGSIFKERLPLRPA